MAANNRSREMNIVFVYDLEKCQSEHDDPIAALAYFHPSWVSDVHRLTLCGQLMGVSQFLHINFTEAKMIALQSGKFILTPFGRFVLVVGTDRNITDAALAYRSELLATVVRLYHKSLECVYEQCMANSSNYKTVTDKFYHIFETYLPLLQHQGSVFNSLPTLKMPPSANCVFVEAIQTLQDCRQMKGVLGGQILYHNKIVSTQLPPSVSKMLVITDPYRIKTTAAQVTASFDIPLGVQLVVVYMSTRDYQKLRADSQRAFGIQNSNYTQIGGLLPFQMKRKTKTREKSSLFSNIPEEEPVNGFGDTGELSSKRNGAVKPRPTHLPLLVKNGTSRDGPESGISSMNFDETDSFPSFIGRANVFSTPLLENKIFQGDPIAICATKTIPEEEPETNGHTVVSPGNGFKRQMEAKLAKMSFNNIRGNSLKNALIKYPSLRPLQAVLNSKNELNRPHSKPKFRTITDPSFPVFNDDGLPISKSLYDQCDVELGVDIALDVESLKIEGFPMANDVLDEDILVVGQQEKTEATNDATAVAVEEEDSILSAIVFRDKPKDSAEAKRRSLSLPIQPITLNSSDGDPLDVDQEGEEEADGVEATDDDAFPDKPVKRKRPDFPVTPLMSKIIAQLPLDPSWASSGRFTPLMTPIDAEKSFLRRRSSIGRVEEGNEEQTEEEANELQRVELLVCGQQNMTLLVVMEEASAELVKRLWETSIHRLAKIESHLLQTLNVNVDGVVDKNDMNYSYMCLDPKWDVIQQGGHWTADELQVVEEMHGDFAENGTFTETLVRCSESAVYGYRCGETEIYYKQPTSQLRGIAPPGDGMVTAPLNAKRRLERDHSIILL